MVIYAFEKKHVFFSETAVKSFQTNQLNERKNNRVLYIIILISRKSGIYNTITFLR